MPKEFPGKNERSLPRRALVWLGALAVAGAATAIGYHMEKAEPAGTAEMSASQQAFLDTTAADTATRLLNDRFAFTKEVHTGDGSTTISVSQDMPKGSSVNRYANLTYTFEGTSPGTDAASVEHFLHSQHPHLLSANVSKWGDFKLTVNGPDSAQPDVDVAVPTIAMHPNNDDYPLSQLSAYERAAAVANGMNGADNPGGITSSDLGRLLPPNMPVSTGS